jgi:hypothetical protein
MGAILVVCFELAKAGARALDAVIQKISIPQIKGKSNEK